MRCKKCNTTVKSHKKRLKIYGYCLSCLPKQHQCEGIKANRKRCHYAKLKGKDYCARHYRYSNVYTNKNNKYGYVYIMDIGFGDLYKIGITKSPANRLQALRASNPRLSIVYKEEVGDMKYVESECHRRLTPYFVEREIFKLDSSELKAAIKLIERLKQLDIMLR